MKPLLALCMILALALPTLAQTDPDALHLCRIWPVTPTEDFGCWAHGDQTSFTFEAPGFPPPADWTGLALIGMGDDFGTPHVVTDFLPDTDTPSFEADGQWWQAIYPDLVIQCSVEVVPWVVTEASSWSGLKELFD